VGQIYLKRKICEALDYPGKPQNDLDLTKLKELFAKTLGIFQSYPSRFIGYKTSAGTDEFPNPWYGCADLFIYPRD
jgi:hypothetical protein